MVEQIIELAVPAPPELDADATFRPLWQTVQLPSLSGTGSSQIPISRRESCHPCSEILSGFSEALNTTGARIANICVKAAGSVNMVVRDGRPNCTGQAHPRSVCNFHRLIFTDLISRPGKFVPLAEVCQLDRSVLPTPLAH